MRHTDYYEVLGVEEDSPQEEIDERYNRLTDFLTADSVQDEVRPWAERHLTLVEEAYAVLGDVTKRRDYDLRRRGQAAAAFTPHAPLQAPATARRRRPHTSPGAVAAPGGGWWARGPVPVVIGGVFAGVAILLLIAVGTGNWDKVSGLFGSSSDDGGTSQSGLVDEKRVSELEAAVQQNPANLEALFELGETYFNAEEWASTTYWFGRLLDVDPANTHALNDVALANFYLGRYQEARASWDRALELEPDDPLLHYSLAFFLLNSPPYDQAEARDHFQKVVELAPDSDIAQLALDYVEAFDVTQAGATPEAGGEGNP